MLTGVHVSISGSIDLAIDRAMALGCQTFQIFTRNPRGWDFDELRDEDVNTFRTKLESSGLRDPLVHMPYLPNIASPVSPIYEKSVAALVSELKRGSMLSIDYLVVHLGSHMGSGIEKGIKKVAAACNKALSRVEGDTTILLENTSGSVNSVGSTFEQLRAIIDRIERKKRVGICLDTCHAFAAGYDLRTRGDVTHTFELFDKILGLDILRALHVNDSKGPLGSGLDRHEHVGMGHIKEAGFRAIFRDPLIMRIPLILETPIDGRRDERGNLAKIRELAS